MSKNGSKKLTQCECCAYYAYDEEEDCYFCETDLDMDETERFLSFSGYNCPYYTPGDEYKIVRHQN